MSVNDGNCVTFVQDTKEFTALYLLADRTNDTK